MFTKLKCSSQDLALAAFFVISISLISNLTLATPTDDLTEDDGESTTLVYEEINTNPLFPPKTDAFWEQEQEQDDPNSNIRKGTNLDEDGDRIPVNVEDIEERSSTKRPNIILILTDDQDIELGSMDYMPETLKVFRDAGVEFRHGYVTTPMCCPSRSSMLTGLYVHNHQVYTNNDNCSSVHWRERFEKKTFAAHLWESGYYTSYIGKYLNKYDGSHVPYGWDEWNGLLMNSRFYNYTLNRNGRKFRYGASYQHDYYPDSIANDTMDFLRRMGLPPSHPDTPDKMRGSQTPFLLVVSFPSPHGPEDSAPQYSQMFFNQTPHHTPSYNYAPNLDKQWILRVTPAMSPNLRLYTDTLMTKRLQTLQSVDLAVKHMFESLKASRLFENTYVFYTSDHGYHVGQFGLIKGKSMPYEFDIRVPFFLSTPGLIRGGTVIREPVLNIDLAPTFLELAGLSVPLDMDGRSMVPLLRKYADSRPEEVPLEWSYTFLIESSGRRENVETAGATTPKSTKKHRHPPNPAATGAEPNETAEKKALCDLHPHPCLPGQKKYCRQEKGRVRFRKCRQSTDFLFEETQLDVKPESCPCRSKRSVLPLPLDFDWEVERLKIDSEIEALKLKIDQLRDRRREMRRRWSAMGVPKLVPAQKIKHSGMHAHPEQERTAKTVAASTSTTTTTSTTPVTTVAIISEDEDDEDDEADFEDQFFRAVGNESLDLHSEEDELDADADVDDEDDLEDALFVAPGRNTSDHRGRKGHNRSRVFQETSESCNCANLDPRWVRQRERAERKRKKLRGKLRKKMRYLNRIQDPDERHQAETCGTADKINCFWHDKDHWRTPPLWTGKSFCFCMNSNNNTYSCVRSINSTHNYLYCQFITGFKMYFDLKQDPYELINLIGSLPSSQEDWMLAELVRLKECRGRLECGEQSKFRRVSDSPRRNRGQDFSLQPSIWEKIFGTRWKRKKNRSSRTRKFHNGGG